jgi:hypothetical protein
VKLTRERDGLSGQQRGGVDRVDAPILSGDVPVALP